MQTVFPAQADLPDALPTGVVTPIPLRSPSPKRRETILTLVEMLLQNDGDDDRGGCKSSSEDSKEIPGVDEHLQALGAEAFNRFQRRVNHLDNELRSFANASRQLGSSVAILSSAFHLRERLAQILFLYQENAADLFPRKISHVHKDPPSESPSRRRRRGRAVKTKTPLHVANVTPTVDQNLDLEFFPDQLEALATDVATFLDCLNEFPEFTDEGLNASIRSFEGDLKYWASCLRDFSGHFRYPSVQRYMHDLSTEMGDHIDSITSSLSTFIEVGVPTIRFAQKHGANNLLNLSTVATFFSAVTATTLQFSFQLNHTPSATAVNVLWFSSMVFSIAAAVNSLLGVTWKQAMYRSPGHKVPWWVLIWIKRSPLVFLVMSVACFSIGLCCFAYATEQAGVTSTLTTVFTAFTSFGLTAVSAWFASERYIFLRHRGQKWLSDVLNEYWALLMCLPGMKRMEKIVDITTERLNQLASSLHRFSLRLLGIAYAHSTSSEYTDDLEANALPLAHSFNVAIASPPTLPRRPTDVASELPRSPAIPPPTSPTLSNEKEIQILTSPVSPPAISPGRQLWRNALRSIQMHAAASSVSGTSVVVTREPRPGQTAPSNTAAAGERFRLIGEEVHKGVIQHTSLAVLQLKLKDLEPTQDLAAHSGLVRHLQFSPDGKYLATSSWDRTSMVFRVGNPFTSHRVLAHPQGFVNQVAWSPDGKYLLTKLSRYIKIWTAAEGVCINTIDRKTNVGSITWFPDGKAFISVEGSDVIKLGLQGHIIDGYDFGRMKLHDVAVTPDASRLIGVGPLLESPSGLQPSKSRAEKRLVVYNMDTKQCENQTPVLNDVRDITVVKGRAGATLALVSYENKAPPQLWKLDMLKDRETTAINARLTLKHTYMPKMQVDFAGPSYFGGKNNELVLCAGKAGDIHIWDQESGALLHHIKAQAHGGDLTCIAWNHAFEKPFMFAAGSHDGAVRIWTRRPDDTDSDYVESECRAIPRTNSPLELIDGSSHQATQQDPESKSTSREELPVLASRKYSTRSPSYPSGCMIQSTSRDSTQQLPSPTSSRPMTLPQRILAYAAAQRAAEAEAVEPGRPPDTTSDP